MVVAFINKTSDMLIKHRLYRANAKLGNIYFENKQKKIAMKQ